MTAMLCLPHSNADAERVFSALKLIKTRLRSRLLHSTLSHLLRCKVNGKILGLDSEDWNPSKEFLARACTTLSVLQKWRKQQARKQAAIAAAAAAGAAADAEADALDMMEVMEEGRQFAEHDELMAMMQDEALWDEWGAENGDAVQALNGAMPAEEMRSGVFINP